MESLALTILRLMAWICTVTYYTLARTRAQGLVGFVEGAELLAAMITYEWDKFWPQGGSAVLDMLDWLNTRSGNILRQQTSFAESDLPLLYHCRTALQLICDKLQQVELKHPPRVENLFYFIQNTRKRLEPQPRNNTDAVPQATVRTLVYARKSNAPMVTETLSSLPELPEMRVEVRGLADNGCIADQGSPVKGFMAGIAATAVIAAVLWWWQVYPMQQQLAQVRDTAQGAATVWLTSPDPDSYGQQFATAS